MRTLIAARVAIGLALGLVGCGGEGGHGAASKTQTPSAAAKTAAASASSITSDDAPIMHGDHSVIRQEAVGPLHVGEWRRPVMSFVYAISARAGRDSEDIIVVRGIGKDTVTLTFDNDTLRRVFITHQGPRTADGLGVGTPFATVAAQPGAKTTTRRTAQVATLTRLCGVQFATDSVALSQDSVARKPEQPRTQLHPGQPATIRAISIGYCKP